MALPALKKLLPGYTVKVREVLKIKVEWSEVQL